MNKILKENNLKQTASREVILNQFKLTKLPITAEDLYNKVNKKAKVNLSTVYRTLNTLCKKGVLMKQVMNDKKTYYQLNESTHTHILVCEICGKKIPIKECPMHNLENQLTKETGFIINGHNLQIFGICPSCQSLS